MTVGLLALALSVAACGFGGSQAADDDADTTDLPGDAGDDPADDSDDTPPGPCEAVGTTCEGEVTLRACTMVGASPVDTTCAWGCVATPTAHCGALIPTADGVDRDDVADGAFDGLGDVVISNGAVVNGSDPGTITGVSPDDYQSLVKGDGDHVRVFKARSFVFDGDVTLLGDRSIQFVAGGRITVRGVISAVGPCTTGDNAILPGPGGYRGGLNNTAGAGPTGVGGGGGGESTSTRGGGGGGNGAPGGSGGNVANVSGNGGGVHPAAITLLFGGSGGGAGGGGGGYGRGGGGGGAVHLISNTEIVFEMTGGINAGGCGGDGDSGGGGDGGGGGGAGGTIVLEAPGVTGIGDLAANGGGGGSGGNAGGAGKGMNGQLSRTAAAGQPGNAADPGSDGASGGVALMLEGGTALDAPGDAGGGGGGIGRIHFSTRTGRATVTLGGVHSPALDDTPSTATAVSASVE